MSSASIQQMTCTRLPTDAGEFQLCLYHSNENDGKDHLALIMGDVSNQSDVLVRVHSECYTGDVLGSLRCDCGPQLHRAMHLIAREGQGVLVYLRQEGRGIGLLDKLRAYNLQDKGYDTVEANLMLGHAADTRDYTVAALILQNLGVQSLRLMTNNPSKIASMEQCGLPVTARVPLQLPFNDENLAYLATKVQRMQHLLTLNDIENELVTPNPAVVIRAPQPERPFVTLSFAQSLDGSITAERGEPMALSGPEAYQLTHQLRARHDAILVGVGTVIADNPRLDVRHAIGPDPQPIVVDSQLRFPLDAMLLQNKNRRPWIITTDTADIARQRILEDSGAQVIRVPANEQGQVQLVKLLNELSSRNIQSLMVEGGARIITSFLANHLVDRLVVTIAPLLVGGLSAVNHLDRVADVVFPRLANLHTQHLGKDIVLSGDVVWE